MELLASLFAAAFLAATILPFSSEAMLAGALLGSEQSWATLIAVASLGNILGSVVNWALGRAIAQARPTRWLKADPKRLARAQLWYQKWGRWSLLLSWVPIIGDPLTVVAGLLREPLIVFLPLVAVAKVGRYLAVAAAASGFF